jgi:AcrR family transcriptional regulator
MYGRAIARMTFSTAAIEARQRAQRRSESNNRAPAVQERPMTARPDRRVQRTRQLIRAAFRELLEEKGYEALTVQDIIDRANVGRATFYAHFDNKDELFASGFDELRASLKARQRAALSSGGEIGDRVFGFTYDMFVHANEYRGVFHAMMDKQSGAVVQRLLRKLLVDLVRDDVKAATGNSASAVRVDAIAQFIAGGLFCLLLWWLDARPRVSAAEVNALFRELAMPALAGGAK